MSDEPWLWLIAGPNGAGKSTFGSSLSAQIPVVNPDKLGPRHLAEVPVKGIFAPGRLAVHRTQELRKVRSSFAIETTLSGRRHLVLAREAKSEGWNLRLVYIVLASPELALKRVEERRRIGGHDVPAREVRRRYERSLMNLHLVFRLADEVFVLDNSNAARAMRRLIVARQQQIVFKAARLPAWLRNALGSELRAKGRPE